MSFNFVEARSLIMASKAAVWWFSLYFGKPGTQLCAACLGPQRRTGAAFA
jgi:hypothetical protein